MQTPRTEIRSKRTYMSPPRWTHRLFLACLLSLSTALWTLSGQSVTAPPAVPVDPIVAILDAFRSHSLVGLGEPHRNEQAHRLRLALIRDDRIASVVNDLVVEFGDARYQDVIDRFTRGEQVSNDALRPVWQNTTQGHTVWDVPTYEEFFRAVRAANASRPRELQFRVLLGDPPTAWEKVRSWEDVSRPMADYGRERYPARMILREVLAKKRRALIIYGDGHLWHDVGFPTLGLLKSEAGTKVFTIASSGDLFDCKIKLMPLPTTGLEARSPAPSCRRRSAVMPCI
jgi:Haem-binding uptake, Tiki superfamily, ChaN